MKKKNKLLPSISIVLAGLALSLGVVGVIKNKQNHSVEPVHAYTNGDAATYYSGISDSLSGNDLLTALRSLNLSKRKETVGYNSMGTTPSGQFKYTDYDPNYVQYDSNGQPYGTRISSFYTYTSATSWNREHVWPNSHGGGSGGSAGTPYPDADIHMPRPTISSENSSRGNSFFVEGMNHSSNGWDPYTAGYSAESRGEAARITFYCMTVNSKLSLAPNNTAPSGKDPITGNSYSSGTTMGNLETLLKWTINYPVTQREKNRNEGAEYLQGNRNAFVDHPEYACRIWGNVNSTTKSLCASASWDDTPGVSVSRSTASVAVDSTITINATSTDNSTISWSSDDETVVEISSATSSSGANVTLTGVGPGTATITASATINSTVYTATCIVTVTSSGGGGGEETDADYVLIKSSSSVSNGDKVVIAMDLEREEVMGVTGWNNSNDATVSNSDSNWKQYTVTNASNSGFKLKDDAANQYVAAPTSNHFKYDSSGGTVKPDSEGHFLSNSRYLCKNGTYYRCYTSIGSYIPFYVYKVNTSVGKTLSSISVSTAPTKTTYTAGEMFDPTGLVIRRNYSDSTYDTYTYSGHTSEFTFSPSTSTALTTSNVSVTITYGGKSTSQAITVNATAKTLSSITISGYKISFTLDESFSFGGTVTANFSDSTSSNVTASATFSGYNMSVAGNYTVTVSYTYGGTTKTTTYQITVNSSGGSGGQSEEESETLVMSEQGFTSGADVSSATGENCTVSFAKNGGNNSPKYYDSGTAVRVYPSNTITVSSTTLTIIEITFTFGGSDGSNSITSNPSGFSSPTWTGSSSSVVFTIGGSSGHRRIASITVTYESSGSTEDPTSITATANRTFYVGETITKSDITVKTNLNKTITDYTFSDNNYKFTYSDAASGGSDTNKTFTNTISYNSLTCSLSVNVQRKAYTAPTGSTASHTGSEFSSGGIGNSYSVGQTATVDGITFTVDGYIYNSKLSLSSSQKSAPGKVVNTTPYSAGITDVTVSGATPDIQLSTDGSDWIDLSSATPETVNYFYFKIFYKTTSQSNYVNITQINVTLKGEENPANLANYVMYEDTNNQCTTKLSVAMGYLGDMSSANRTTFATSDDYVISTARERLEAWAANQGKVITYSTATLANASNIYSSIENQNSSTLIIVIIASLSISSVGVCLLIRKKKIVSK